MLLRTLSNSYDTMINYPRIPTQNTPPWPCFRKAASLAMENHIFGIDKIDHA